MGRREVVTLGVVLHSLPPDGSPLPTPEIWERVRDARQDPYTSYTSVASRLQQAEDKGLVGSLRIPDDRRRWWYWRSPVVNDINDHYEDANETGGQP